ncbi:MAG: tRNA pseudouridine(55) synthase TruB [Candidatus Dormibacteria bacterium]
MRRRGVNCSGIINLDKPAGMTSTTAVAVVKRALDARRVGHAGTLDPMATGVLPICVGAATRLVEYAHRWSKTYHAWVRLGVVSDTYDADGALSAVADPSGVTLDAVRAVLPRFSGRIIQRPPAYSALRSQGRRLHALARAGETVVAPEREVSVDRIDLLAFIPGPEATVELLIECSTGTYVRTIAHDLGLALETGGHLARLVRTAYGPLKIEDAVTLDSVRDSDPATARALLLAPDRLVLDLPAVTLGPEQRARILNGNAVAFEDRLLPGAAVRAYWEGTLVAIARVSPARTLEPLKVFPDEVTAG